MKFTGESYVSGSISLEHEHRYQFCLNFVRDCKVLEIASGEGFGSSVLATHAKSVLGIDINPQAVSHASDRYSHENLQFLVGSSSNIPVPDNSFDVVIRFEEIEHHEGMMREIIRVLRPGGVLIMSSPDKRMYRDERDVRNEFHAEKLYVDEFDALMRGHFSHVAIFGQRLVYGPALLERGSSVLQSWEIDQTEPVSASHEPMFKVAVASDDPSWAGIARSGPLEDTVYPREALIERTQELQREKSDLDEKKPSANDLQGQAKDYRREGGASRNMRSLVFHPSGKPRGWMRKLLLKDNAGTPRPALRRILFKKNGRIRPSFAKWYTRILEKSYKSGTDRDYTRFLGTLIASGNLSEIRTVHVVTTMHTEFIAEGFAAALRNTRLTVTKSTEMPKKFYHDLYIVVAPQMFASMPPPEKLIAVQVEQVRASRWVDDRYVHRLKNSLAILDYSRDNIEALINRGIPSKQIYYFPIRPLRRGSQGNTERDIDVLFYGAKGSERRKKYISALSERVNLRVETDTFGADLHKILNRTKVVVNIHFYENAILETTRISEALSHGAQVVSEDAVDQIDHEPFCDLVNFVPRNEVENFVQRVEATLAAWKAPADVPQNEGIDGMSFHVLRALHGIGVLSLAELQAACGDMVLPSNRIILALPEQLQRYETARKRCLPSAVPFHGLRQLRGWQGCAESYKFLATLAIAQNLRCLTVYEDDAIFESDANQRLTAIEGYLDSREDWDIFSGLLTDLHPEARICGVDRAAGEEFVELDSVIGMVFGIYSRSGLQILANFEFEGSDSNFHTIDRWLERKGPRTLTVIPPFVNHDESLESTLWTLNNSLMTPMIHGSIKRLEEKLAAFCAEQKTTDNNHTELTPKLETSAK